jgi:hypothetical protein
VVNGPADPTSDTVTGSPGVKPVARTVSTPPGATEAADAPPAGLRGWSSPAGAGAELVGSGALGRGGVVDGTGTPGRDGVGVVGGRVLVGSAGLGAVVPGVDVGAAVDGPGLAPAVVGLTAAQSSALGRV